MTNINYLSLKEVQTESLKVLKFIDEVCQKNGFHYFIAYGTLLGAIRHQDIIPWDDDVDIWMPREDYNKFTEYCITNADKIRPLELLSPRNKDYPYMISRLSNSNYILEEDNVKPYGLGVFVDIYPLDGVGSNLSDSYALKRKVCKYVSLCFLSTRVNFSIERTKGFFKLLIKYPAYVLAKILGKEYFFNKIQKIADAQDYASSKYVSCLVWDPLSAVKFVFSKDDFVNPVKVKLGDYMFNAPSNSHEILKLIYNDYMKLPPKEDRIGYHFARAYLKNKDIK